MAPRCFVVAVAGWIGDSALVRTETETRILWVLAGCLMMGDTMAKDPPKEWSDPALAASEDQDFRVQGEYAGKGIGMRVAAMGGGMFYVTHYAGGLPGAGWDGGKVPNETMDAAAVAKATKELKKVERESPTLGAAPPAGAIVLFAGKENERLRGKVHDGLLWAGSETTKEYGSFRLHVEFRTPYRPTEPLTSQGRGNSGLYLQNRYEVQILDSFGLVYDKDQVGIPLKSAVKQWCASFYTFKTPDVPMCFPPLRWQTYDITFQAARFDAEGKKVGNTTITVVHNGVKVQDAVELPHGTGVGSGRKEAPTGPIIFQGHGEPVAFRNVWLVEQP